MFEAAFGTAAMFIGLALYFDIRKVAGYAWLVDIAVFTLTLWMFHGTYAGMMTGIWAGLIFTVFMRLIRKCVGYKQLALRRKRGELLPTVQWEMME